MQQAAEAGYWPQLLVHHLGGRMVRVRRGVYADVAQSERRCFGPVPASAVLRTPPKQLSLFIPRGQLELPAITALLGAQLRDAAPSRLSWMKLLARVFRVDISVCSRCSGPMRLTRAVTTPGDIAAELRGARPPPRAPPLGQLLLFSASPAAP